ncbi:MAG: hypothetical protein AVDCRST_MAG42-2883 [uncultured Chthoniobacterales bacterium]|uniref:Uncharacterized protein n=1 Tax=uncultured Chthoniobacterales bacterium TaxID=1836801 RepID=A0A6J4IWQ0_9BACT|nr:MAG: hypothetical protein AVDCRST_MAG42-2883 [uncultured Chthoniobacterales bacterium]
MIGRWHQDSVIPSAVEGSVVDLSMRDKGYAGIPPLRFAPVGMTACSG